MAQIFYVHCPACERRFPCHPELWQVDYELLCPFCQTSFPQEESPLIITMTGEQRVGRAAAHPLGGATGRTQAAPVTRSSAGIPADPSAAAESM